MLRREKRLTLPPVYRNLLQLFFEVPGAGSHPVIVLEHLSQPTKYIDFHCGGDNATSTTLIALNDSTEYEGGSLVYFLRKTVQPVLDVRPAGSIVQHPSNVLHGVTTLLSGTRQSLFVVDKSNVRDHWAVLDKSHVSEEDVRNFAESKRPEVEDCVVCIMRPADHALVPCGHLCLCADCVEAVNDICPKCRTKIDGKTKIRSPVSEKGGGSKCPKVEDCVACAMRPADHALLPCGHLCLCGYCASIEPANDTCPKCQAKIEGELKIYF